MHRIAACAAAVLCLLAGATPAFADVARSRQWHLAALDVTAAHRLSRGDGVTVAVIDTGVDARHPDLAGNVLPGIDLIGGSDDGRIDRDGHGTAMAGLVAAHGHGTGDGALGIAPRARILPVRASYGHVGDAGLTAQGIDLAVERGAQVILIAASTGAIARLSRAVENAVAHDVVVVASVGNRPSDVAVGYPARYPGVLAAGATGRTGGLAKVSVTGPEVVMTAPGVDIVSTDVRRGYRIGTGTSDSAAILGGAAALVRAEFPDATAAEVIHRLTATATDKGAPGRDDRYGYGVLDLVSALTRTDIPAPAPPAPRASAAVPVPSVAIPEPLVDDSGPLLRFTPAFYLAATLAVLMLAVGGAVLIWLFARRRRP
jgi:type VII secretion-associated serine protease mycosin